jgi:hypothetical protein
MQAWPICDLCLIELLEAERPDGELDAAKALLATCTPAQHPMPGFQRCAMPVCQFQHLTTRWQGEA